ncbi:MAG: hypothetical protein IT430_05965 [Phycisphaerales bacterium]|nr:hypothetical protein [Phycisphaerales bacterium]
MTKNTVPSTRTERLMKALYEAQQDLDELARKEKMTLTRLAGWANNADTIAALDGLCRLNDVRAQLLVSRYRTLAAARLFELAKDEAAGELARKACVDLLKVCLIPLTGGDGAGLHAQAAPGVVDEAAVRRLLCELGKEAGREGSAEANQPAGAD